MSNFTSLKRRFVPSAAAKRRATELARPFLTAFEDWNHRAAKSSAIILSRLSSEEERAAQRRQLEALRAEVKAAYAEFHQAIEGAEPHDRLTDVAAAFERQLQIIDRL
ncbi:hypothetical protein LJR016_005225 [Devosia sp. LjRoot16]|jgi:hypothetical protein|uniref:hypothetical protein n=1 Tax=Devosia sp. LjRoot16 TaxID=3342271 RepID=UPI003ECD1601